MGKKKVDPRDLLHELELWGEQDKVFGEIDDLDNKGWWLIQSGVMELCTPDQWRKFFVQDNWDDDFYGILKYTGDIRTSYFSGDSEKAVAYRREVIEWSEVYLDLRVNNNMENTMPINQDPTDYKEDDNAVVLY